MKRTLVMALLAAIVTAGTCVIVAAGQDPIGWKGEIRYGWVGLARGQTARLSIVAVGGLPEHPPSPCVVSLRFLDAGGKPFVDPNGRPVATPPLQLVPGQAVSLDLPASIAFGQNAGSRAVFRAHGDIAGSIDPELSCPKPIATLEIFDALTGRTQLAGSVEPDLFPKSPVYFPNDPELLRFGMAGIARGQTARISVLAVAGDSQFPPNPCVATLGFVDAAGQAFTDANGLPIATEFKLMPGETAQLDLRSADAFRGSVAMRKGMRPTVSLAGIVDPELSCARPLVTVEIFDVLTGRTQVLLWPVDPEV